jgi:hypothetical protein
MLFRQNPGERNVGRRREPSKELPQCPQAIRQSRWGRNTGRRRKPVRGFRSFRKRSANCGGVDVPAQRQAAGAVRPARQPASRPRRSSGFCRQRVVRRTWRCSSTWFRSPCKPYRTDSQVFLKYISAGVFAHHAAQKLDSACHSPCISETTRPFTRCFAATHVCALRKSR